VADVSRCRATEELLSAYLDGELLPDELAAAVEHLDGCETCIVTMRQLGEVRAAVRLLPWLEPPAETYVGLHPGDELSAYLDGELTTAEVELVTTHLGSCHDCRNELHDLDAARTAVRALRRVEPASSPVAPAAAAMGRGRHRRRLTLATAAAAATTAMVLAIAMATGGGGAPLDRASLATRHSARTSVEAGFSVIPASVSLEGVP